MTDKDSFCELIRRNEKAMYAVALSVVGNDADAADVIGEAILRAYEKIYTLRDADAFKPWLLRIVRNTAVELVRKNSRVIYTEQHDGAYDSPESTLAIGLSLREAVKSLRQPYRTVIELYYYENMSVRQIAKITDTGEGAVKKLLSRARKMLRELLKEDFVNE